MRIGRAGRPRLVYGALASAPAAAILLAAAAVAATFLPGRLLAPGTILGAFALCGAHFLAFRWEPFWLLLLLCAATFLLAGVFLFAQGRRGPALAAMPVFALFLLLAGTEAALGFVQSGPRGFTERNEGRISKKDARLTHRHLPNATARHVSTLDDGTTEFDVVYTLEADGSRRIPNRPADGPERLVFGGSFTFGLGVADEDAFPAALQALDPGSRYVNLGVNGYGAADVRIHLEETLKARPGAASAAYYLITDHFRRAACPDVMTRMEWGMRKPRFELKDGRPRYLGPAYDSLSPLRRLNVDLLKRSRLWRAAFDRYRIDDEAVRLVHGLVLDMRDECAKRGMPLSVVLMPYGAPDAREEERIAGFGASVEAAGVSFRDLRPRFADWCREQGRAPGDFFFRNNHPKPELHRLIAEWSADLVR